MNTAEENAEENAVAAAVAITQMRTLLGIPSSDAHGWDEVLTVEEKCALCIFANIDPVFHGWPWERMKKDEQKKIRLAARAAAHWAQYF